MNISEFFLSFGKQTSKLMNLILNVLFTLTLSSLLYSLITPNYEKNIHQLLESHSILRLNITFAVSDWNFIIQWGAMTYLLATLIYFFDSWLLPGGSNLQYLWETFSEILLCFVFIQIIIRNNFIFKLIVNNIFWLILPAIILFLYSSSYFSALYLRRIKDKKSER
ncbi:hypothetical protein [Lactococcus lactis]|uniref:hypothetical protein n=1 Tax=Lactococcus lactis TaxID=1358 RepID=UPI0019140CDD|nr:hypothetical protein [Lactococcus lactis]MCC4121516.1 hypothetical protein [Lactococcus lactis]WDA67315.1 hypothetical protein IL310_00115 [Lactococcus lactis]